jgi:hypothetical protein
MDNKKEHLIVASRGCCKTGLYTRGLLEHLKRTDKYTYNCCLLYIYYSGYNILTNEEIEFCKNLIKEFKVDDKDY